jgi:hypothetical protein
MLKKPCKSTIYYYDTHDRINPSLPLLKIRGGGWGYKGWLAKYKAYKESLEKLF